MRAIENTIKIENAQLIFKPNFEGREEQYNREGDRNFNVELTPEQAEQMEKAGWNVKSWVGKEEGDEPVYYLKVAVSYKIKPPRLVMITSRGRMPLDEDTCEVLDWTEYEFCDVIISPYDWKVNGKTGRKAYLKTGFFVVREDELEQKYAHLPEVSLDPVLALPPGNDPNVIDGEIVGEWEDDPQLAETVRKAIEA